MYKLDLVDIYEIGFLKSDFGHIAGFGATIKHLLQVYPERSEGFRSSLSNWIEVYNTILL